MNEPRLQIAKPTLAPDLVPTYGKAVSMKHFCSVVTVY